MRFYLLQGSQCCSCGYGAPAWKARCLRFPTQGLGTVVLCGLPLGIAVPCGLPMGTQGHRVPCLVLLCRCRAAATCGVQPGRVLG